MQPGSENDSTAPVVPLEPHALHGGSPRPTALVWQASPGSEGAHVVLADSGGFVAVARVGSALAKAGPAASPMAELDVPISFPLWVPKLRSKVADASETGAKTKEKDAPAVDAMEAVKILADLEAEEADSDEDEDGEGDVSLQALSARKERRAAAAAAAAAASASKSSTASGDADLQISVSGMKRAHGFVDADGEGDDGVGGLKYTGPPEGEEDDHGGGRGRRRGYGVDVADLIADGKIITADRLEAHMFTVGRYVKEVYGLVAPQRAFQPGSTRGKKASAAASGGMRPVRRYLCWNAVGAITSRQDSLQHTINIDFVDSVSDSNCLAGGYGP